MFRNFSRCERRKILSGCGVILGAGIEVSGGHQVAISTGKNRTRRKTLCRGMKLGSQSHRPTATWANRNLCKKDASWYQTKTFLWKLRHDGEFRQVVTLLQSNFLFDRKLTLQPHFSREYFFNRSDVSEARLSGLSIVANLSSCLLCRHFHRSFAFSQSKQQPSRISRICASGAIVDVCHRAFYRHAAWWMTAENARTVNLWRFP